jgi:hypothetical protein
MATSTTAHNMSGFEAAVEGKSRCNFVALGCLSACSPSLPLRRASSHSHSGARATSFYIVVLLCSSPRVWVFVLGGACEGGRDTCALARGKRARGMLSVQEGRLDLGPDITEEKKVD